MKLSIVM